MSDSSSKETAFEKQVTEHTQKLADDVIRCSFCHKSQNAVAKLISSPSDYPRAYICNECVEVCNSILWEDEHGSDQIRLFYSYSHKDERLRVKLDEHLDVLKREGIIADWHDGKITPGVEWASKMRS